MTQASEPGLGAAVGTEGGRPALRAEEGGSSTFSDFQVGPAFPHSRFWGGPLEREREGHRILGCFVSFN